MAQAGILAEDDRIELIGGEIVEMSPIGRDHASTVARVAALFYRTFADGACMWPQNPLHLSDDTEPQPDLALLRFRDDFYASELPLAGDVLLVVEVSDSSATYDRRFKVPLYSRHGIPEAWLVDLNHGKITIYRHPDPTGYGTSRIIGRGERLSPASFPDRELEAGEMLG
jgi:Uma2 family endonuclease